MNEFEPKIKLVSDNIVKDEFRLTKNSDKSSDNMPVASDRVSLSQNIESQSSSRVSKNGTGEIRHHLVDKFKNVLKDGTYSIKADEIADKLVQNIRDNKNHLMF